MIRPARLRDRIPGILAALGFQAGLALLLIFSFPVVKRLTQERETVLNLAPPLPPVPPRAVIIDGRPRPQQRSRLQLPPPPAGTPALPAPAPAPSPPPVPPAGSQAPPQDLVRLPPRPPATITPPDKGMVELNPPSGVQDEKRWESEMARKNTPPDAGVSVGVGIGITITDPLCKLAWVLLGGGFKCGAAPAHHDASDAQVEAAVAAANARKRALSDASVLMSAGNTGDSHAKDGTSGGNGAAAGGATGSGR